MTKEDILSTIVYIGMIAIAILIGVFVIQPLLQDNILGSVNPYAVTITSVIVGVIFNVILIEVGHVLGAKMGGYNILSINFLGLAFFKVLNEEGKLKTKVKFPQNFDGLTGETIVTPKDKKKANPMFYVFVPLLLVALEASGIYFAMAFIDNDTQALGWLKVAIIIVATIGLMFILYNFIPAKLDSKTDGYRLVLLTKKINIEAYNELLRIEGEEFLNKTPTDLVIFDTITELTAQVNLITIESMIEKNETEEAKALLNKIVEEGSKISKETLRNTKNTYLSLLLLEKNSEEAKKYYDEVYDTSEKKALSNINDMNSLSTYLLYEGLVEESKTEVEYVISKKNKVIKRYIGTKKTKEEEKYNKYLNLLIEAKPEWFKVQ